MSNSYILWGKIKVCNYDSDVLVGYVMKKYGKLFKSGNSLNLRCPLQHVILCLMSLPEHLHAPVVGSAHNGKNIS